MWNEEQRELLASIHRVHFPGLSGSSRIGHYAYDVTGNYIHRVDMSVWAGLLEFASELRVVDRTTIPGVDISTVFLGLDHNFMLDGFPVLFETMIFGGMLDGYCQRYRLWSQATVGHRVAVAAAIEAERNRFGKLNWCVRRCTFFLLPLILKIRRYIGNKRNVNGRGAETEDPRNNQGV